MNYLVLYVNDIDISRVFYEDLGMNLVEERHEKGPRHYSFENNGLIIELYPKGQRTASNVRLGLTTNESNLVTGDVIVDPDGNRVEMILNTG